MFDLAITDSTPTPALRSQLTTRLAGVLSKHAHMARADVARRRDYLQSRLQGCAPENSRMLEIDVARANALSAQLMDLAAHPRREAELRLGSLLHLLDGPIEQLEFGNECLAARVRPEQTRGHRTRIVLLPELRRRRRVQVQDLERGDPTTLQQSGARCYGDTGQAYIGWALNRMDVSSLILVVLAYLRVN